MIVLHKIVIISFYFLFNLGRNLPGNVLNDKIITNELTIKMMIRYIGTAIRIEKSYRE